MKSIMKNGLYSLPLMCLLAVLPAHAAEVVAPDVLAKNVTAEVLAILHADKDIQAGDPRKGNKSSLAPFDSAQRPGITLE